jgi:2-amino-4-hydroxy-6-hydroxymethyldihydropteridine diphosphokinase
MNPDRLAVVALGSNLGDSDALLEAALERLRSMADGFFAASTPIRSQPVDCPPGSPDFLNAVAAFEAAPQWQPRALLLQLQAWERDFGRRPKQVHNEARPLDLDLIGFGPVVMQSPELTLPHPRAHLRAFVLAPLAEILPDLQLPGWTASARDLLSRLNR